MSSDAEVNDLGYLDSNASALVPRFRQQGDDGSGGVIPTDLSGPYWTASEVRLLLGAEPSRAICHIPMASTDETAPTICGVTTSPLAGIKIGTPAAVFDMPAGVENVVITGYVQKVQQNLKDDTATVTIVDHRWALAAVFVVGQLWYNATSNTVSYRQGWRCVMNEGGQPNCCPDPQGLPVFCNANLGLLSTEEPATDISQSYDSNGHPQAMYWTPQLALDYFQRVFSDANTIATYMLPSFPWYPSVPAGLTWPPGLSSSVVQINSLTLNSIRKAPEWDWEGMKLVDVLQALAQAAGPYSLYVTPDPTGYTGTLQILRTRYDGTAPLVVARATGGNANPVMNDVVFCAGEIEDDGTDLFTMFVVSGDNVHIEIRLDTVSGSLRKGWDDSTFTQWKNYQTTNGSTTDSIAANAAFEQANAQFNKTVRAYRLEPTYDFQQGTSESTYPRAEAGRPPLPHLLSSYLEGTGSTLSDRLSAPYAIQFEYSTDGGSTWKLCPTESGLGIDPVDGSIYVDALRKAGQNPDGTWNGFTWAGSLFTPGSITANDIRVTLAIPCDHRLVQTLKIPIDQTASVTASADTNEDNPLIEKSLSRFWYADCAHLYSKDLPNTTVGDWPVPQTVAASTAQAQVLRDDTTYAAEHVKRKLADFGRVRRSGRLVYPHLYSLWAPGFQIATMQNRSLNTYSEYPIRAVVHTVIFRAGKGQNVTEILLG